MRCVSTRVLPEPAPARMSSGPSPCRTASRCGGFRPSRRASMAASAGMLPEDASARRGRVRVPRAVALTDDIRAGAERVARAARSVRIDEGAIAVYAETLEAESPPAPDLEGAGDEARAAFSLQLNAINFGSGWFRVLH